MTTAGTRPRLSESNVISMHGLTLFTITINIRYFDIINHSLLLVGWPVLATPPPKEGQTLAG